MPTLIITLGTANVFNGVMQGALQIRADQHDPRSPCSFGSSSLFVARNESSGLQSSMPVSFLIPVRVVAVAFVVTRYTMFGRSPTPSAATKARPRASDSKYAPPFWLYVIVGIIAALPVWSAPAPWDRCTPPTCSVWK